jgi:hypothetical protein
VAKIPHGQVILIMNGTNAANWTEGVPCSISNVTITDVTSAPNYPIISSNTACKDIVFEPEEQCLAYNT